jgi:hypothetical protein
MSYIRFSLDVLPIFKKKVRFQFFHVKTGLSNASKTIGAYSSDVSVCSTSASCLFLLFDDHRISLIILGTWKQIVHINRKHGLVQH